MVVGMQYGSRGWAAGWLLWTVACGGAGSSEEADVSFGPGVGTQVDSDETAAPSTGTPTTGLETTSGGSDSEASVTGTSTEAVPTTSDATSTGDVSSTTGGTTDVEPGTSTGDPSTGEELCQAPGLLLVCDDQDDDPFHALGLGCEGAPENTIPITNAQFKSNLYGFTVASGFGSAEDPDEPGALLFRPREGEKFLVISTGEIAELQPDGVLLEVNPQFENDNNFNPDNPNSLPAPMSPLVGSNGGVGGTPSVDCDGINDCSDSIDPNWVLGNKDPNDILWGSFDITVPGGTHGYSFDVAYFSSEYPDFVGQKFNDMFIGWATSEAYTGNVTFLNSQPFTVTALGAEMESAGFIGDDPELAGTGFEGHGSTGWATVNAQASPGETFTFALAIMDMGDSSKATLAVLDNWRWSCVGCVPAEQDPECGQPDHPKCCGLCVEAIHDPKCGTMGHPKCCVGE
jgi:hypothetical protein